MGKRGTRKPNLRDSIPRSTAKDGMGGEGGGIRAAQESAEDEMGVKIRKEDPPARRIHGDHLRYKGRRSVFLPPYLSFLRVHVCVWVCMWVCVDVHVQGVPFEP